jgi:nucleotide-binding universal stress UspA family protein
MNDSKKRILVATDGSVHSFNAAGYISGIMPPETTSVVLFHVDAEVLDLYADVEKQAHKMDMEKASYMEWIAMRRKNMLERLEKTRDLFVEKGFPAKNVEIISREIRTGVTRDIIEESLRDYDLLVVGKTGARSITGVSVGSVTEKLVSKISHIPMAVIEGRPETRRILVGFDGSNGSVKAIRTIYGLADSGKSYTLCHVIRSMNVLAGDFDVFPASIDQTFIPKFDIQRIAHQKKSMEAAMKTEQEWMISQGASGSQVQTAILEGYMSRSQALVEKAKKEGYGSLVLGRRGHSAVVEFFIGRVGKKVVEMCDGMAVWIMN